MIPALIPLLVGGGTAAAAYAARRAAAKKGKAAQGEASPETDDTLALPPAGAACAEPPDLWGFAARWLATDAAAAHAEPSPRAPESVADEPSVSLLRRAVSPSGVTVVLAVLAAVVCLVPSWQVSVLGWQGDGTAVARLVIMSAFVGIGTNFVAVKMLFHPRRRVRVLGIQGVIPKRRQQLVDGLARGIRDNLLDPETIRQAIHDSGLVHGAVDQFLDSGRALLQNPEFRSDLARVIDQALRAFVDNAGFRQRVFDHFEALARRVPPSLFKGLQQERARVLRTTAQDWIEKKARQRRPEIMAALDDQLGEVIQDLCDSVLAGLDALPAAVEAGREQLEEHLSKLVCDNAEQIDIEAVIRKRMESMDEGELEALIHRSTDHELATIQYLGAALGALAGTLLVFAS